MSKKSLWGFYDGEPFMENPHLVVLNARKKGKTMAKKSAKSHMAYVRSFRKGGKKKTSRRPKVTLVRAKKHTHWGKVASHKRRVNPPKRRRNAFPIAGMLANRRRRKNPSLANLSFMGVRVPDLTSVAYVTGGFLGTPLVEKTAKTFLPVNMVATINGSKFWGYAFKIASATALSLATKYVLGNDAAKKVAIGGATYIVVYAVNDYSATAGVGRAGMGSYNRSTTLGSYASSQQLRALTPGPGASQSYSGGSAAAGASRFTRTNRFGGR